MRFLSLFSGIEAASAAWEPLGWECAAVAEIDPFPCAVLAHHYPNVPNMGDVNKFKEWPDATVDLLVGGTPCQSFSIAGLRKGLADPRGNLMLTYLAIARRYAPRLLVWENVPGVLSSNGGRDFGTLLGGLAELGYGFAYRVLDAQYVRVESHARAVPQRRRRVFVVGYLGNWRRAAAVLFERESLLGHPAPRRQAGQGIAKAVACRATGGGGLGTDEACGGYLQAWGGNNTSGSIEVATALNACNSASGRMDFESETFITQPVADTLTRSWHNSNGAIAGNRVGVINPIFHGAAVRRLLPVECEALQGFPRGYTAIPYRGKLAADGPRYKALGNSMAVNCMRWIGVRIGAVEAMTAMEAA